MPIVIGILTGLASIFFMLFYAVRLAIDTSETAKVLTEIKVLLMKAENERK